MPTTREEVSAIFEIVAEYMSHDEAKELLSKLVERVAMVTDNYSVRTSLFMLYRLYNPTWLPTKENVDALFEMWDQEKMSFCEFIGLTEEDLNRITSQVFLKNPK